MSEERLITVRAAWGGPVVETWLTTLTPVHDRPTTLLELAGAAEIREAYRDRAGHYVLVLSGERMSAE